MRGAGGNLSAMEKPPEPRFLDDRLAYWAQTKPEGTAINYLSRTWT